MNNKGILIGIVVIVIVALGGFFVLNMNKSTTNTLNENVSPTASPVSESEATPPATNVTEITIEGEEFEFTPSQITVKKGEKVKLTFKNTGKFPHDYVITDLNIATKRIQPGEEDTVEFTPNETGEFQFICSVGNHEEQGMVGTLMVE